MRKLYETINAENWHRGSLHNDDSTAFCLGGHLLQVGRSASDETVNAAVCMLFPDRVNPRRPFALICFNDHPDTTVEDVIRVCKCADV